MTDTLYYDGKCALCSHEIRLLARLKDSSLILIDIHGQANQQSTWDKLTLMSVLHLQTSSGKWIKGLDATVQAWKHTKLGFLFIPLRWPVIRTVADYFYTKWANSRVCKLD